jgi:hypothetical protein
MAANRLAWYGISWPVDNNHLVEKIQRNRGPFPVYIRVPNFEIASTRYQGHIIN